MLKDILKAIHPTSDEVLDQYLSHWKTAIFSRKQFVLREGERERYFYFVLEGVQKSYFIQGDKEYILAFTHPNTFTGDPKSLFTGNPSSVYIECLTKSKFLRIDRDRHFECLAEYCELSTLYRKATERILVGVIERYGELMSHSIEERFKSFATRSPHLFNIIPHKDLASYLRINPTNFSTLYNSVKF